jgi:hypothetical protein
MAQLSHRLSPNDGGTGSGTAGETATVRGGKGLGQGLEDTAHRNLGARIRR